MKRQELQAEHDRLSAQLKILRDAVGVCPDEIISMGCQKLCISICGSLEQCLKQIFVGYGRAHSNDRIHRSISKVCESYQNPKSGKILELVGLFDDDFERQLKSDWESHQNQEQDHINNMVDDRINIAHRKRIHTSVSTGKLENYLTAYKAITIRIHNHFLGSRPPKPPPPPVPARPPQTRACTARSPPPAPSPFRGCRTA